jgi:hypothetical protein
MIQIAGSIRHCVNGNVKSITIMAKNSKQAAIAVSMKAAGKKPKMAPGGSFKPVDASKNPGLAKLPTEVRNKMGYAKKGGTVKKKK